jgi:hypothetical protein
MSEQEILSGPFLNKVITVDDVGIAISPKDHHTYSMTMIVAGVDGIYVYGLGENGLPDPSSGIFCEFKTQIRARVGFGVSTKATIYLIAPATKTCPVIVQEFTRK